MILKYFDFIFVVLWVCCILNTKKSITETSINTVVHCSHMRAASNSCTRSITYLPHPPLLLLNAMLLLRYYKHAHCQYWHQHFLSFCWRYHALLPLMRYIAIIIHSLSLFLVHLCRTNFALKKSSGFPNLTHRVLLGVRVLL